MHNTTQGSGLPKTFLNIISSEFAERCSFYAVTALTPVYLTTRFALADTAAASIMYRFNMVAYVTCVLGGLVADWYLGRFRAILIFSWFTVLGHLLLGFYLHNLAGFQVALLCIAVGTGFIKPNVSALLGDQYAGQPDEAQLTRAFNWFYFSVNAGSVLSFSLAPVLPQMEGVGWAGAYAFPAIMMAMALFLLWTGRKKYLRIPATGTPKNTFVGMNLEALRLYFQKPGQSAWQLMEEKYGVEKVDGVRAVWRASIFFLFTPIAWSVYYTNGVDWLLDARSAFMDKNFFGLTLQAAQLQTVNPICILSFIPLSLWLFPRLERWTGLQFHTKRKMLIGFVLLSGALLLESWVSHQIDLQRTVHAGWQVLALVILSAAEVLMSISGLQYGYTHAPKSMKSTIGAIWLLTNAVGNGLNAGLNALAENQPAFAFLQCNTYLYWLLGSLLTINILLYWAAMSRIREKMYL